MIDLQAPLASWLPTVWYPGFLRGMPDLLVGRWPDVFRRPAGNESYKVWFVCSPRERQALLDALSRPVPTKGGALDFRAGPDAAVTGAVDIDDFVGLYASPGAEWPWITVTSTTLPAGSSAGLARGRFAWDSDETEAGTLDRIARLQAILPAPVRVPGRSDG
ncbi:hypothetical protein ACT6QG_06595 [Xanthobacter sp. TB0136]|uniref:hypothetical protein n=1 Tax=Xanthobacter sp. TB0136 TaxID=3459177 RepID=UPI00403A2710